MQFILKLKNGSPYLQKTPHQDHELLWFIYTKGNILTWCIKKMTLLVVCLSQITYEQSYKQL